MAPEWSAWTAALAVALGGAAGSAARYAVGRLVVSFGQPTHYGTLTVNLLGAFALGLLLAMPAPEWTMLLLGTGFLGGFTTFSTLMVQLVYMTSGRQFARMATYAALTFGCGLPLAAAGYAAGLLLG